MNNQDDINSEVKKISKKMNQFVVIGLGKFGRSVATTLAELGKEVLVIDTNQDVINQMENIVSGAVVADATGNDVLYSLGVQNFDCAIVCIKDLEASILATAICKDLGVNYVVAKAKTEQIKKVLTRVGADMVVFPEVYMGKKVANMLTNPSMNEILNLTENFKIVEVAVPDAWQDKTILELDIRKKYKVSIIFIRREGGVLSCEPDTKFMRGDTIIIAGESNKLEDISNMSSDVIDAKNSFGDALEDIL